MTVTNTQQFQHSPSFSIVLHPAPTPLYFSTINCNAKFAPSFWLDFPEMLACQGQLSLVMSALTFKIPL